jgi:hypothetical protein
MYDRKDLTIKLVEPTSEAELLQIFATDIWKMWDHTFIPPEDASPLDNQSINVTLSRLAWKYRTYTEFFPDHNVPLEQLRNFLLVPLQFSVTAMQYVNYTMALPPADIQDFALELMTTATGGQSIQKFVSPLWTSLTFIASGCAVVLLSGIAFVRILSQDSPVPTSSGITEIDFASRLAEAGAQVVEEGRGEVEAPLETAPLRDLINVVQRRGEGERSQSNFNTLQRLRIETTGAPSGEGSRAAYHPSLRIVPSRRQEMPMFPPTTRTNQEYDGGGSSDSSVKN